MSILIKSPTSRVAVNQLNDLTATPLGVEYEELSRNLERRTLDKYKDRIDLREKQEPLSNKVKIEDQGVEKKDKTTFILSPGMLINYENGQHDSPAYPMSDIPSTKGFPWSDNF